MEVVERIGPAVLSAVVLAVAAAWLLLPPDAGPGQPLTLVVAGVVGVAHGLVVSGLAVRIGTDPAPDLVRWVALSYGAALLAFGIGLLVPFFRSWVVLGLAFVAGAALPLFRRHLVLRP